MMAMFADIVLEPGGIIADDTEIARNGPGTPYLGLQPAPVGVANLTRVRCHTRFDEFIAGRK